MGKAQHAPHPALLLGTTAPWQAGTRVLVACPWRRVVTRDTRRGLPYTAAVVGANTRRTPTQPARRDRATEAPGSGLDGGLTEAAGAPPGQSGCPEFRPQSRRPGSGGIGDGAADPAASGARHGADGAAFRLQVLFEERLHRAVELVLVLLAAEAMALVVLDLSLTLAADGNAAGISVAQGHHRHRSHDEPLPAGTATLHLSSSYAADAGWYDCIVYNGCGSVNTTPALLSICIGDFNCDGGVDGGDVEVLRGVGSGESAADVNSVMAALTAAMWMCSCRWESGVLKSGGS